LSDERQKAGQVLHDTSTCNGQAEIILKILHGKTPLISALLFRKTASAGPDAGIFSHGYPGCTKVKS
jgi:hypothetical protein